MQTIVLPISPAYIDHWDLAQGIKELVSNCSDSVNRDRELMEFFTSNNDDGTIDLTIGNKIVDGKLEPKHLVLGVSENRNKENAIGQFGEGMKLAFITLLRNGIQTFVENDDERWEVVLAFDETFGTELPHIHITDDESTDHVRFHMKGLDKQTVINVMSMVWEFLPESVFQLEGEDVTIRYLEEADGDFSGLFVGGIFMGELHPRFAINTSPIDIPVNRDRKLPDDLAVVKERVSALLMQQFSFGVMPELIEDTPVRKHAFVQLMEALGIFSDFDESPSADQQENDINLWLSIAQLERTMERNIEAIRGMRFCSDYNTSKAKGYHHIGWESEQRLRRVAKAKDFEWLDGSIVTATYKGASLIYGEMLSSVYTALKEAGMEQEAAKGKTVELLEDLRVYAGKGESEGWDI